MRIKYPKAIGKREEDLTKLEQRLRGQKVADRVCMLRLLKSGVVNSLKDCAPLIGKLRAITWSASGASGPKTASRSGDSSRSIVCLWKTGRRRHKKASAEQQAACKKTSEAWSSIRRFRGWWLSMRAALSSRRGCDDAGVHWGNVPLGLCKMSTSGCGCMLRWNPPPALAFFCCSRPLKATAWSSSYDICATSWARVRLGSCWIVRAVIAVVRSDGQRACTRSICRLIVLN